MSIKKKIKKILKSNKRAYGAYRKIRDKKRNKCFKKNGEKFIGEVCERLSRSNLKIFCAYGTLLGFVREGGIIPYDLDIDMGVIDEKGFSWDKLDEAMSELGFKVRHYFLYKNTITEKTYEKEKVTIDFFRYKKVKDELKGFVYFKDETISYKDEDDYSVKINRIPLIKKISKKEINGVCVLLPDNNIEILESLYGEGWRIPDPNFEGKEEIVKGDISKLCRVKKR